MTICSSRLKIDYWWLLIYANYYLALGNETSFNEVTVYCLLLDDCEISNSV